MVFLLLLLAVAAPAAAQIEPFDDQGVAIGHVHLNVLNVDSAEKFWVDQLGATAVKVGSAKVMKFPGILVMLRQKDKVDGASEGSAVESIAFRAQNLESFVSRWKAAGVKVHRYEKGRRASIYTPEEARITVFEQANVPAPIVFFGLLLRSSDPAASMEYYRKLLHLKSPGDPARFILDLPGGRVTFAKADKPVEPSRGRAIDHIGFEIRDLEKRARKLEERGLKIDLPYRKLQSLGTGTMFLTDPSGASINLTEGLGKL